MRWRNRLGAKPLAFRRLGLLAGFHFRSGRSIGLHRRIRRLTGHHLDLFEPVGVLGPLIAGLVHRREFFGGNEPLREHAAIDEKRARIAGWRNDVAPAEPHPAGRATNLLALPQQVVARNREEVAGLRCRSSGRN